VQLADLGEQVLEGRADGTLVDDVLALVGFQGLVVGGDGLVIGLD
jgi:hypothetical protein